MTFFKLFGFQHPVNGSNIPTRGQQKCDDRSEKYHANFIESDRVKSRKN